MMSEYCVLYITTETEKQAEDIARALLDQKLVACVNIHSPMRSHYWWEGKIQHGREIPVFAKTLQSKVDDAIACIKAIHSYDCPAIVSLPISAGNPEFLEWINASTRKGD
jgi:periplasmic divalent cation tolerance protein